MTYLKKILKESGLKQNKIAELIKIKTRTLQRWSNYEGLENTIKFLILIKKFNIDIDKLINDYNNKKEDL